MLSYRSPYIWYFVTLILLIITFGITSITQADDTTLNCFPVSFYIPLIWLILFVCLFFVFYNFEESFSRLKQFLFVCCNLVALVFFFIGGNEVTLSSEECHDDHPYVALFIFVMWLIHLFVSISILGYACMVIFLWVLGSPYWFEDEGSTDIVAISDPLHVDWVLDDKIGISMSPGRKQGIHNRDLYSDLSYLQNEQHVDLVVTLLSSAESRQMKIENIEDMATSLGLEFIAMDIRDKWIPRSATEFKKVVQQICTALNEDKKVLIHCNGGYGRSGLMTAAVLLEHGDCVTVKEAINTVRQARDGTLANLFQRLYLYHFYALFHK